MTMNLYTILGTRYLMGLVVIFFLLTLKVLYRSDKIKTREEEAWGWIQYLIAVLWAIML